MLICMKINFSLKYVNHDYLLLKTDFPIDSPMLISLNSVEHFLIRLKIENSTTYDHDWIS